MVDLNSGCLLLECKYWNGIKCTDPVDYVDFITGEPVCGRREGAIPAETDRPTELESQLAEAQADNAALLDALEETVEGLAVFLSINCCGEGDGKDRKADGEDYGYSSTLRKIKPMLSSPHPGADLFKELAQLRKVRDAAEELILFNDQVGLDIKDDGADSMGRRAYDSIMRKLSNTLAGDA